MKKSLLTLCILWTSVTSNAQTNTFPSTGNVGIGTTSPGAALHIYNGNILLEDNHALRSNGSLGAALIYRTTAGQISLGSGEMNDWLIFNAGGDEKARINTLGNFGIGTTNPIDRLHVNGSDAGMRITGSNRARINLITATYNGWQVEVGDTNANQDAGDLGFTEAGYASRLVIKRGGNVGIGTISPAEKLSVNGKIRAKEIKVETSNWPDYVFEPDYQLRDLKATEQFIKENRHLPEIPSAKEAAVNGISLGEMNAKLLQKIEELTLYLIEQHKEIITLKVQMKEVQRRN